MLYPWAHPAAANRQVQRTGARLAVAPHATHALGAGGAGLDGSAPHSYTGIPCGPPTQGFVRDVSGGTTHAARSVSCKASPACLRHVEADEALRRR